MNIKNRVERIEAGQSSAHDGEPCPNCAGLRAALAREYGDEFPPFIHSAQACAELHRNIVKIYGRG